MFVALTALPAPSLARQCAANGVKAPSGWTGFASRLLASEGVSDARALGLAACAATDDPDVRAAVERLHGGTNAAGRPAIPDGQLMQRLSAPMNKMDLLARAPELTARRPSVTWRQVVANHAVLAVNIGPAAKAARTAPTRPCPTGREGSWARSSSSRCATRSNAPARAGRTPAGASACTSTS